MGRKWTLALLFLGAWIVSHPAESQFSGTAVYELGTTTTDVGEDGGNATTMHGFGVSASYAFLSTKSAGLVAGADLLVRGFGVHVPGRVDRGAGVFDQSALILDEFVALRMRGVRAGLYLEQHRIDRGTQLGKLAFPSSAIGFLVGTDLGPDERTSARFSYARFYSGRLQLPGSSVEPEVESGRSFRVSIRHRFSSRWGVQGEYANVELELEDIPPTFTFFDHRQSSLSVGVLLVF